MAVFQEIKHRGNDLTGTCDYQFLLKITYCLLLSLGFPKLISFKETPSSAEILIDVGVSVIARQVTQT